LLLRDGQSAQRHIRRNFQTKSAKMNGSVRIHFLPINQPKRFERAAQHWLTAKKNIRRDIQIVQHVQLLMDEANPKPNRIVDRMNLNRRAFDSDFPSIRLIKPAKDFHQRRFPCAVFAKQGDDFRGVDLKINRVQRDNARKAFANAAHFKQRSRRVHQNFML
jgi:hypothetical protein